PQVIGDGVRVDEQIAGVIDQHLSAENNQRIERQAKLAAAHRHQEYSGDQANRHVHQRAARAGEKRRPPAARSTYEGQSAERPQQNLARVAADVARSESVAEFVQQNNAEQNQARDNRVLKTQPAARAGKEYVENHQQDQAGVD